ncbi:MAG: GIY-YIG nuclease family protein [Candidatus Dojkabacteria bacterium]|nr:GIY-YIG nuclease family protein [Candidatus Dojkabacteria bacterium]
MNYYVYIIESISCSGRLYRGFTRNLTRRMKQHNAGKSKHTNQFKPWKIRTYLVFDNRNSAEQFEKYLKTSSGKAFTNKRLVPQ